ncbi:MAG TPA: MBL fold metallo-hydrolase [Tepidisphaeraceae bacterium]|jgi:glyoxylase-like metal-dependent hydrolase (beta-lactamase superfamily II)|nr:MBL fold metallo-hydrolase [Tepidisphaeraceae bacterium]
MRYTTLPDWFTATEVGPGVVRINEPYYRQDYRCNILLIKGHDRDLLIDTGLGLGNLRQFLRPMSENPLLICSHSHYDHIGSNFEFPERLIHPAEADVVAQPTQRNTFADPVLLTKDFSTLPWPGWDANDWSPPPAPATGSLNEGDVLELGDRSLRVLHTPGHSWGSICLWDERSRELFCADTVYEGEIFDFLPCSDVPTYVKSMQRLRELPVRVAYPGHGPVLEEAAFFGIVDGYIARNAN